MGVATFMAEAKVPHTCETLRAQQTLEPCPACDLFDVETRLQERDARVEATLRSFIEEERSAAELAREEAMQHERTADFILIATQAEHWWKLKGFLSEADIDSLSECSPAGLLDSYFNAQKS